jgi:hypothetical protein
MDKTLRSLSTKSETAGAIRHALSQWRALARYLDDGLLKVDNSVITELADAYPGYPCLFRTDLPIALSIDSQVAITGVPGRTPTQKVFYFISPVCAS